MGRQVKSESDRRSRLVSLAYKVLSDMKTPTDDEMTDEEMLSLLSRAFLDKATALTRFKRTHVPKERRGTFMFSNGGESVSPARRSLKM
jgi:hypothetical protein